MIVPSAKTLLMQADPWNGIGASSAKVVTVEVARTKYSALVIITPEREDPITLSLPELEETLAGLKEALVGFAR